ncbi:intermembrane transport protein PqiB [Pollutimonas sp. M17]|uniref:PqiB family protein n=1 Tax=Pollutimonas sp. M17 TaxID=2962065 RepID=UPI0021F4FB22|nr:MlaD family protein [Pollutimonas sp. M17]UYO95163.1 MlaD family protein [Pollutimonas sp. M17]
MTDPSTTSKSNEDGKAGGDDAGLTAGRGAPLQPHVRPRRERRISWIWLVPLVAALVGASLLVRNWLHTGPTITISFESAEGLEVGQTKIRYKDVVIGVVSGIKVSSDRSKVLVSADLNREGSEYITQKGSRFWVVRPRLGLSGVSGLGTLLSGAYISVDAAESSNGDDPVYAFEGLEKPPEITSGRPGTRYTLYSADLGSLEIGSPVYFRRIQVGRVIGYDLDKDGKSVNIQIFIDAPNDKFVTSDTRFWNASGINLSLDADGFNVQTGSLVSVVAGGVAFASVNEANTEPAKADSRYALGATRVEAMADPDGPPFPIELHFHQSVRGLKVGAPVDFRGLELGKVVDIDLEFNQKTKRFYALVKAELYPLRFGAVYDNLMKLDSDADYPGAVLLAPLVKHGLRGQIRAANLLTGQQYVALDFFPDAESADFDAKQVPVVLPTIAGSFDRLQQQISSIVGKLDAIPFEGIGKDLRSSLTSMTKLLKRFEGELTPQATTMLKTAQKSLERIDRVLAEDSPLSSNVERTLGEINAAAKSLRALSDYLRTNPSALVRGRAPDALPVSP